MPLIAPAAEWDSLSRKMAAEVPEVFASEGRVLNLFEGEWKNVGFERHYTSAIDGRSLGRIPMLDLDSALAAGKFAKSEARSWAAVDLDERRRRVSACLAGLKQHRELIALLLMWEIGKPHAQALTDIDRCISGVEWYVQNIESMLAGRSPLGLISNIASWNLSHVGVDALGPRPGACGQCDPLQNPQRWRPLLAHRGPRARSPRRAARLAGQRFRRPTQ